MLGPTKGSKRYILRSDMNATARIWLILVASNIKPSKYLTKISRKTVLLLYLLMTNQHVKLEVIIHKSLYDTDAKLKPKQLLDYKRVGKVRVDPDDPCTSEAQAHPTAEASSKLVAAKF
ncbi:uncharacterized protein G2W53_026845 [Senna tora]|uniref:Uncharacterized protein n=1 Tax=Senna tora TaxID=362788 RepID=A0A834WFH1_9FABA|nr:uncharacterized protein G2W53_026845 [Senna tora]